MFTAFNNTHIAGTSACISPTDSKIRTSKRNVFRLFAMTQAVMLLCGCDSATDLKDARFVLRSVRGIPISENRDNLVCSSTLAGTIVFARWTTGTNGTAVLSHTIRTRDLADAIDTVVVSDTAAYTRSNHEVTLVFAKGSNVTFTIEQNGLRLTTLNAGCYPGQRGAVFDMPLPLVYEE